MWSSKKLEIFIAVLGVTITALLGYGQYSLGKNQLEVQRKSSVDLIEMQAMTMVGPYLGDLGKGDEKGETAERVVTETADFLSRKYKRISIANLANSLIEKSKTVGQMTKTRIAEATQAAPTQTSRQEKNYFAVLASYPIDQLDQAKEAANEMLKLVKAGGSEEPVELWKTKISKNYAVVVGGRLEKEKAFQLAKTARAKHWADDAFWQIDKEWSPIGTSPF